MICLLFHHTAGASILIQSFSSNLQLIFQVSYQIHLSISFKPCELTTMQSISFSTELYLSMCIEGVSVCTCVYRSFQSSRKCWVSWSWSYRQLSCKCWYWQQNMGPLKDVFLNDHSYLQSSFFFFKICYSIIWLKCFIIFTFTIIVNKILYQKHFCKLWLMQWKTITSFFYVLHKPH